MGGLLSWSSLNFRPGLFFLGLGWGFLRVPTILPHGKLLWLVFSKSFLPSISRPLVSIGVGFLSPRRFPAPPRSGGFCFYPWISTCVWVSCFLSCPQRQILFLFLPYVQWNFVWALEVRELAAPVIEALRQGFGKVGDALGMSINQ